MKIIVAVDKNWAIGKDGGLLFSIPEDMEFFKKMTMGHVIVMGRKTFESFPGKKALPGRINIVLTRQKDWKEDNAIVVHNKDELIDKIKKYNTDDVYIIGGGEIYKEFLYLCDTIIVTHIDEEAEADVYFPNLEADDNFYKEEIIKTSEYENRKISFCVWKMKK